ncbi:hypothetical protein [Micromonospora sp. KC213]|uniref:hypothetical protein n=1 Tax=Micromonospora sp. KC213 TaxID=2530378 RepID=UPI001047B8B9|nr:hypothetical protein [Micromonospora sp. KC213]TDC31074.1 hypothetical protein E1166_28295 [Micromonospora sp. KC213]
MTTADETSAATTRRQIIKSGVVAGVGVGAAAVVASPASAAAGDPVIMGAVNNDAGTAETVLVGGSSASPTLALNPPAGRPALQIMPVFDQDVPAELPTGSLAYTHEGDLVIGGKAGTKQYVSTSRWANRTVAIQPKRILDTRALPSSTIYDQYIAAGRSSVDSTGRLRANSFIHLSLSNLSVASTGRAVGVYVNLTVAGTVSAGVLSAYPASTSGRPSTSSLNWWGPNQILSNLVEVQLSALDGRNYCFTIWVNAATSVIVDVSGLIMSNPGTY